MRLSQPFLSIVLCLITLFVTPASRAATPVITDYVDLATSQGTITVALYGKVSQSTVQNFLAYVNAKLYAGTMIHRLVPGFMFQGGWLNIYGHPISTFAPIANEAGISHLSNTLGTIAMARGSDPYSTTSQFFINLANNSWQLDYGSQNAPEGYAVFGTVVQGLSVAGAIGKLTPFNISDLPFPVTPNGQMVVIAGAFSSTVEQAATPSLRILFAGTGGGAVRSSPGGICSGGTCAYTVKAGQKVSLTATAAAGSYFPVGQEIAPAAIGP